MRALLKDSQGQRVEIGELVLAHLAESHSEQLVHRRVAKLEPERVPVRLSVFLVFHLRSPLGIRDDYNTVAHLIQDELRLLPLFDFFLARDEQFHLGRILPVVLNQQDDGLENENEGS